MRYKDISGKEIVNINNGARLGVLGQTDLQIDVKTGKINAFIIPNYKWFGIRKEETIETIPWDTIRKIGKDMILIETGNE